ncbi:hypothetical protein BV510_24840, partial [Mycolicibacterium diernhoferi]
DRRPGDDDTRANAVVLVNLAIDPAKVTTDLTEARAALRDGLRSGGRNRRRRRAGRRPRMRFEVRRHRRFRRQQPVPKRPSTIGPAIPILH